MSWVLIILLSGSYAHPPIVIQGYETEQKCRSGAELVVGGLKEHYGQPNGFGTYFPFAFVDRWKCVQGGPG